MCLYIYIVIHHMKKRGTSEFFLLAGASFVSKEVSCVTNTRSHQPDAEKVKLVRPSLCIETRACAT